MKKENTGKKNMGRFCGIAAAAVLVCSSVGLNASPAFAKEAAGLPVVGTLAQVLTISSHSTKGGVSTDLKIPKIKLDSSMPKAVNDAIAKAADKYAEDAKAEFAQYKKEFFANGGTQAEWADRDMSVSIDYKVRSNTKDTLSLELITAKNWTSAEEEHSFYNIDLKNDKALTLEALLGKDYIKKCNDSIVSQINKKIAADENAIFFGYGKDDGVGAEKFTTITPDTKFYVNEKGNAVVVFDAYEIAPGYMGTQAFEIAE